MTEKTQTGAELFVNALERYDVRYLFGNPETTELPLLQALEGQDVEYVLGLHEDVAVGAAAGFATTQRYHGTGGVPPVGVVNLHVAPDLAHGLGNLWGEDSGRPARRHRRQPQHRLPARGADSSR